MEIKMSVLIDSKIKRFVKGYIEENTGVVSIYLTDIGETFHFDNENLAQIFLNKQVIERVGNKELRSGYFDYADETGENRRYQIEVNRGKIVSYSDECIPQ